jgi:hypothetical protein
VTAVELPADPARPHLRRFEARWSVEPLAVRAVARAGTEVAVASAPDLEAVLKSRFAQPLATTYDPLRASTSLTNRVLASLVPSP